MGFGGGGGTPQHGEKTGKKDDRDRPIVRPEGTQAIHEKNVKFQHSFREQEDLKPKQNKLIG